MGMENTVAMYIRISLEDDDIQDGKEESNSITNQRALLKKYISGHEDFAGASVRSSWMTGIRAGIWTAPVSRR